MEYKTRKGEITVGTFGNEVCLTDAARDLQKLEGIAVKVVDRRRLEIRLLKEENRKIVEDTIVQNYGYVELDPFPKAKKPKKH
ncbi:MAG: hypothetical protein ACE5KG_04495 [Nitrososphaerales archaeon]